VCVCVCDRDNEQRPLAFGVRCALGDLRGLGRVIVWTTFCGTTIVSVSRRSKRQIKVWYLVLLVTTSIHKQRITYLVGNPLVKSGKTTLSTNISLLLAENSFAS